MNTPLSWSSRLWQRSTRRVSGASRASRRKSARTGSPQNDVHQGTIAFDGKTGHLFAMASEGTIRPAAPPAAIVAAVARHDRGER